MQVPVNPSFSVREVVMPLPAIDEEPVSRSQRIGFPLKLQHAISLIGIEDLISHGVSTEIHTFAGTPHGMAGIKLLDGEVKYPNFEMWLPLADAFMQDIYNKHCDQTEARTRSSFEGYKSDLTLYCKKQ